MPRTEPATERPSPYRCLHDGYPLAAETNYRCPECGRVHDPAVLAHWFGGAEEERFRSVLRIIVAILFLKLWFLAPLYDFGRLAGALCAVWTCVLAARGRAFKPGGQYAVGGVIVATVLAIAAAGDLSASYGIDNDVLRPAPYFVLDTACAWLLLAGMMSAERGAELLASRRAMKLTLVMLAVSPLLSLALLDRYGIEALWWWFQNASGSAGYSVMRALLAHGLCTAVWIIVWRWLAKTRRVLFTDLSP